MCLNLRKDHNKRYNSSSIRWKIALINPCQGEGLPLKKLVSYYLGYMYDLGKWIKAFNQKDIKEYKDQLSTTTPHSWRDWRRKFGYHVFLDRKSARRKIKPLNVEYYEHPQLALMKVEVKGFIASGMFNKTKSETYRHMRIIEVFNCEDKSIWKINK